MLGGSIIFLIFVGKILHIEILKNMKKLLVSALVLAMGTTAMAQQVDYSKMSVMLGSMVKERYAEIENTHRAPSSIDPLVMALVKANTEEVFARYGVKVMDSLDDLYIVAMKVSQMEQLSMDSDVVRIEANEPNEPNMDRTPALIGATKVNAGMGLPQAYTGKGVLVGIADAHFDYVHPMFRNPDGTTRIKWAWDMYTGRGATEGYRGIGSMYDTPEKLTAGKGSIDSLDYHGSHVASIAAGSSILNGKYRGIAYESDIVMFEAGLSDGTLDPTRPGTKRTLADNLADDFKSAAGKTLIEEYKYYSTYESNVACFMMMKHFFDYAKEKNQPAVLNCSYGAQSSLYSDYSLEEEFYNKLTGPGRIIVASAGNEGDEDIYRHKAANATLEDSLFVTIKTTRLQFRSKDGDFKITLRLNNAEHSEVTFTPADFDEKANSKMKVTRVKGRRGYYNFGFNYGYRRTLPNGEVAWWISLMVPDRFYVDYLDNKWGMAIKVEGSADIRMHGQSRKLLFKGRKNMRNAIHTVGTVGSYKEVIGVGLMYNRPNFININGKETSYSKSSNPDGYICNWSSAGPTYDGRIKPDVSAPGFNILAAQNSFLTGEEYEDSRRLTCEQWKDGGRTFEMVGLSGTSMSSPVVTGVVALWLQADPTLTPARIKEVIAATAKHPDTSLTYPNNIYGHGDIDAYAGLLKILNATSVIPTLSTKQADITLSGRTLHIQGADVASVTMYSMTGQIIMQTTTTDGTVQLPQLPSAVYAVQVNAKGRSMGSTLIRL